MKLTFLKFRFALSMTWMYFAVAASAECPYNSLSALRPGANLSVSCSGNLATVIWDISGLNVDIEALSVEYSCISPSNTEVQNNTMAISTLYSFNDGTDLVSSTSKIVPIKQAVSCSYFGCAANSQFIWYTFNTAKASCTSMYTSMIPFTASAGSAGSTGDILATATISYIITPTLPSRPPSPEIPTGRDTSWRNPVIAILAIMATLVVMSTGLLYILQRRRRSRSMNLLNKFLFQRNAVDINYFPTSPELMEKISVQYSEFDRLYASKLKLAATDEDVSSTSSFLSKLHPKHNSETSKNIDSAEVGMTSDTIEGTEGCIEPPTDPKVDIIADKHCNHENNVVNSANVPSEDALAECSQLPDCASIEQAKDKPPEINTDLCLSPRQGYFHYQRDITDNDAVLDDVLPEEDIDGWDIESSSASEQ